MSKEDLKKYIANYGEVRAIKDMAYLFQDLSNEWLEVGHKSLAYTFSDASYTLVDVAAKLEIAETIYSKQNDDSIDNDYERMRVEFNKLMHYFQTLSVTDLHKSFSKNKDEMIAKLKRLEFLQKHLNSKNDSKK
jgi:hypothetical protein